MRIVGYSNDGRQIEDVVTLVNDIYRDFPTYGAYRATMVANALDPRNPFFQYGACQGFLAYSGGRPVANACAITDRRLGPAIALTGFFESLPDSSYARAVLQEVVNYFRAERVKTIRGPVDLTTWHGFRVSYPEEESPFYLEPFTRAYYRNFFDDMGFSVAQRNVSTACAANQVGFDRFKINKEQVEAEGFTIVRADADTLPTVLREIHGLVTECFSDSWSFVPISFEEFEYALPQGNELVNRLVIHVAYAESGAPVGFCLGALDDEGRAVVKTVAVVPVQRRLQLARALLHCFYVTAKSGGASEFILSTMRDDNMRVRALVSGQPRIYRQYEVYQLALDREGQ